MLNEVQVKLPWGYNQQRARHGRIKSFCCLNNLRVNSDYRDANLEVGKRGTAFLVDHLIQEKEEIHQVGVELTFWCKTRISWKTGILRTTMYLSSRHAL